MTDLSFYVIAIVGTLVGFGIGYLLAQTDDDDYDDPYGE